MENKYAFFSIDVESFSDTECVANSGFCSSDDMLDGLQTYIGLLDKYDIKATMFTLRDVALKYKSLLSKYISNGHRLALHGNKHTAPLDMTDEQFRRDTLRAKHNLENAFNTQILGYRAPFFSMDREKLEILRSIGFLYDSSLTDFSRARHTTYIEMQDFANPFGQVYIKDGFYVFGNSIEKIFGNNFPISGGGYMRLSPWLFSGSLIGSHLKKSNYYMFYLHPFELSTHKKPYIKNLKFYDKIYLYSGIPHYKSKLERIIKSLIKEGYKFTTFDEVAEKHKFQKEKTE